jgi:hypothetical protein
VHVHVFVFVFVISIIGKRNVAVASMAYAALKWVHEILPLQLNPLIGLYHVEI